MSRGESGKKDETIVLSQGDIAPLSTKYRPWFSSFVTATALTAVNSAQRQFFGNLRLALNTNEAWSEMIKRFATNPKTLLSGWPHRFTLQLLTQGLPIATNLAYASDEQKPKISSSLTALWMTTAGCVFEVSGLAQPIKDKASSLGLSVDYMRRSPAVAMCIIPIMFARNNAYTKLVFGLSDDDMARKLMIATIGAVLTNPIDVAVNVGAWEAAKAKDGTPLTEIYRATWNHFIKTEEGISPYQKFTQIASKAFSGTPLRIAGVAGAALIFSKPSQKKLQMAFEEYVQKTTELWHQFCETIEKKHGGVDLSKDVGSAPFTDFEQDFPIPRTTVKTTETPTQLTTESHEKQKGFSQKTSRNNSR